MRGYPLIFLGLALVSPALADKKLDPDPAFLTKARSAATTAVEPHYDLVSEKVPFWARTGQIPNAHWGQVCHALEQYASRSASTADADRSRAEHQRTMQQYQRENQQIRNEIRAIDRKYGR